MDRGWKNEEKKKGAQGECHRSDWASNEPLYLIKPTIKTNYMSPSLMDEASKQLRSQAKPN